MSPAEHKGRHLDLHRALGELVADYIDSGRPIDDSRMPSRATIADLIEWSYRQAAMPDRAGIHLKNWPSAP